MIKPILPPNQSAPAFLLLKKLWVLLRGGIDNTRKQPLIRHI